MVRTLGYYTKCTGTNPFRGDLNTASTKVSEASTELSDGASEISNDPGCDMGRYNTITNILSSWWNPATAKTPGCKKNCKKNCCAKVCCLVGYL